MFPNKTPASDFIPYSDGDEVDPLNIPTDNDPADKDRTSVLEKPITDQLLHCEVSLPQGEEYQTAKVMSRFKDVNGNIVGGYDDNPLLNTMVYDVEFPDGEIREYAANVIAENILSQVDENGYTTTMLDSILDYKKDGSAFGT